MTDAPPDRRLAGVSHLGLPPTADTAELVDRRAAVADLGDALRELVAAAVATEVHTDVLRAVRDQVAQASAALAATRRRREQPAAVDDLHRGRRMYNPVVGPGSPLAPPMRVELVDAVGAVGTCILSLAYEGPHMFGHGGISALLLDQIMGYAAAAAGHPGVTGRLQLRYRAPVPLEVPLRVVGTVSDVLGSRVAARGTISRADDPGSVLVEAEGRFMTLRREQAVRIFGAAAGASVHD